MVLLCKEQVNSFGIDMNMFGSLCVFESVKEDIPSFGQVSKTNRLSTYWIEIYLAVLANI